MAFERLERPVPPIVNVQVPAEAFQTSGKPKFSPEAIWPAGTPCVCLRKHKDGSECGHRWKTRMAGKPNACPKCKQSRWDVAPRQAKRRQK